MMSEKFSVEDILNEVKNMTGDRYVTGSSVGGRSFEHEKKSEEKREVEVKEDSQSTFFSSQESASATEDTYKNDEKKESLDFSKMSADDFFKELEKNAPVSKKESEIVSGFTVKQEFSDKEEKFEKALKEKFTINVENPVENVKTDEKEPENLEKTMVFDKNEVKSAVRESKKAEDHKDVEEIAEIKESSDESIAQDDLFTSIKKRREHKPEHLLSADEIINGTMADTPSFRFNSKVKDLTKSGKKTADVAQKFAEYTKQPEPEVIPEIEEEPIELKAETEMNADELFNILSEKYIEKEKDERQPDILNNEVEKEDEKDEEVSEIPLEEVLAYEKNAEPVQLDEPVKSTSSNRFSRMTSRRIYEKSFDYSDDANDEEDVIDDYTSIDDEEPVRYDLDVSLKKVSKRLTFTVVAFILSFVVTVLPTLGADFLSFISPESNLTGFLIANAVVLAIIFIINISSFFRGLSSLITFKPDGDSPLSVATVFVIAQSVVACIPDFSATAGNLPFYTSALALGYILNLVGKKSMVLRIKSNFRLVATTAVKQSCFATDDRMCEMLESEDFIGTPYVATSKSVLNLHNYLKNSYCEDPSDNIAKIFAPISLIASVVTFVFTYFSSKDVVSSLSYATAVALVATPVSAILSVNSPLKKASLQFRQKDGLISGYEAVNEFADVDCVAVNAEELFPAGSVELTSLRAIGDISIEDVILMSAALTIGAGGPLADVFDKIIDGRRKMLPPIKDIVYEDGLGLTGNVEGKIVRVGNRKFIDSYGIYGLSDSDIEEKAKRGGFFVIYTAVDDEVCGMFALKYKSIDPDIEDAVYDLVSNGISIAVKTNDPNITPELIEKVYEIPKEYVSVMEAHTAEYYDEITRPSKNGDSIIAYGGNSTVFANLLVACKKLKTKISAAVLIQAIFTILGFGLCMFTAVMGKGFENIGAVNVIVYQIIVAVISVFVPSLIKRIK